MDSTECPVCKSNLIKEQIASLKEEACYLEQEIQDLVSIVTRKKNKIKQLELELNKPE
jgi:hypothetical protein